MPGTPRPCRRSRSASGGSATGPAAVAEPAVAEPAVAEPAVAEPAVAEPGPTGAGRDRAAGVRAVGQRGGAGGNPRPDPVGAARRTRRRATSGRRRGPALPAVLGTGPRRAGGPVRRAGRGLPGDRAPVS